MENETLTLRLLKAPERDKAWDLWRDIFPEDTDAFLAAYAKTHADNRIYGMLSEEKLLAMAQFNPYEVHDGTPDPVKVPYIVGVATRPAYRSLGYMRKLLKEGLVQARGEGAPFAFLMPAAEAIYTPLGFVTVWHQHLFRGKKALAETLQEAEKTGEAVLPDESGLVIRPLSKENLRETARMAEHFLSGASSVFCVRTPEYFRKLQTEMKSEDGDVFVIVEPDGEVAGYLAAWPDGPCEIRELILTSGKKRGFRKFLSLPGETPAIMFRLLDPVRFLTPVHRYTEDEEEMPYRILLHLEDAFLPDNSGWYTWDIHKKQSLVQKISTDAEGKNEIPGGYSVEKVDKLWKTTAEGLVKWRFSDGEGPEIPGLWKAPRIFLNENV